MTSAPKHFAPEVDIIELKRSLAFVMLEMGVATSHEYCICNPLLSVLFDEVLIFVANNQ